MTTPSTPRAAPDDDAPKDPAAHSKSDDMRGADVANGENPDGDLDGQTESDDPRRSPTGT